MFQIRVLGCIVLFICASYRKCSHILLRILLSLIRGMLCVSDTRAVLHSVVHLCIIQGMLTHHATHTPIFDQEDALCFRYACFVA